MSTDKQHFEKILAANLLFVVGTTGGAIWFSWYGIYCLSYALERHLSLAYWVTGSGCYASLGLAFAGFALFAGRSRRRMIEQFNEKSIIQYAHSQGGKALSRLEIAAKSNLTLIETDRKLREMEAAGVCRGLIDERGDITYTFGSATPSLLPNTDEQSRTKTSLDNVATDIVEAEADVQQGRG